MSYEKLENFTIETFDTVILGAGAAGISAASNLLKNGCENFVLVEALDRIGGRCHTIDYADSYLEMGAQWIHGQLNNPIYELACKNNLLEEGHYEVDENFDEDSVNEIKSSFCTVASFSKENDHISNDLEMLFQTQYGTRVSTGLVYSACFELDSILREAETLESNKRLNDNSLGEYIIEQFERNVLNSDKFINASVEVKRLLRALCIWRCKYECAECACSDLSKLSLKYYGAYKQFKGSQLVELKYGYKAIFNNLISKSKEKFYSKLRLNHVVKRILLCEYLQNNDESIECEHCLYTHDSAKSVVIVSCNNRNLVYLCKHVIITTSLGYLKENVKTLISPFKYLNKEKLNSIEKLGFGTVNKIYLIYETPFWQDNTMGIQMIWVPENQDNKNFHVKSNKNNNNSNWYENIIGFERVKGHKNILCAWLYGCECVESFDDNYVQSECTKILRNFLNKPNIPQPVKIIRSNWFSNKFFCGSYSHIALGATNGDIQNLSRPIPSDTIPIVLFAGEATHEQHYSTVHGAYLSGIRESERILNALQKH